MGDCGSATAVLRARSRERVAQREQQRHAEERAGRQDRDQHAVERQVDGKPRTGRARQHRQPGEQRSAAEQLAQRPERDQHAEEPNPGREASERCFHHAAAARDRLGLRHDRAVRDDQRDEETQDLVQFVEHRVAQEIDARHERRGDQQVEGQPRDRQQRAARQREHGIAQRQYAGGREPEREAVDERRRDREQRAEPEQLHERNVVAPQTRRDDGSKVVTRRLHRRLRHSLPLR